MNWYEKSNERTYWKKYRVAALLFKKQERNTYTIGQWVGEFGPQAGRLAGGLNEVCKVVGGDGLLELAVHLQLSGAVLRAVALLQVLGADKRFPLFPEIFCSC